MKANIKLEENLNVKINAKGDLLSSESKGVLTVENPSNSTMLWGIELKADHGDDIIDFADTTIPHIDVGGAHAIDYNARIPLKVEVSEEIDTNYSGEEFNPLNRDLVFNTTQTLAFRLKVKNNYETALKNITVEKQLPQDTKEVRAIDPFPGEVDIIEEESVVSWIIPELAPGDEISLIIASVCIPTKLQAYKSGIIISRFDTDGKLSSLKPVVDGDCDNIDLSIEAKETVTPKQWQLNLGLRNASEFEIFLTNVKIDVNGEEAYFREINQELDGNIEEPIWKEQIAIESDSFPEITKKFEYYVLYDITSHSSITYERESDQILVLKIETAKFFEPNEVTTYAVTDVVSILDITNTGTATLGKIEIEDTIPSYFEVDEISAEAADRLIEIDFLEKAKQITRTTAEERDFATFETIDEEEEVFELEEEFAPVVKDISLERKYHYVITGLSIEPGQIVKVKIKGKANKPRFEGSHSATAEVKAYTKQPTIPYKSEAMMEGKLPVIGVEFKQRSYKATSIFTKKPDDGYNIEIPITNTGDISLDNVIVIQPIFTAEYISHSPPTVDVTTEAADVKCHIKSISAGETVTINLNIRADGPLRQQQATIRIEE
ncbi:MAG: hypothetical protein ACTSQF_07625 [Candidatus Heimdallarchaeaceae archaeon]